MISKLAEPQLQSPVLEPAVKNRRLFHCLYWIQRSDYAFAQLTQIRRARLNICRDRVNVTNSQTHSIVNDYTTRVH